MAAGETFKASVIAQVTDGTAIVMDFGYADTDGNVHIDTNQAAGDFQTLVQALLLAALPDDTTIKKYRFACVKGTHKGEIGYVEGVNMAGEVSAVNRQPTEICISMKRSTGYASRRDRGRIFFGPVANVFTDNANVSKVAVTSNILTDALELLRANLVTQAAGLLPVILAADGSYIANHFVTRVSLGEVFTHHKSRRPRVGA